MGKSLHIKKGDQVVIISGEDKGKKGKVLSLDLKKQKAIVEGANMISKHTKPNAKSPDGGIVKKEAFMHVSKLMLIESKAKTETKVKAKKETKKVSPVKKNKKSEEAAK